MALQYFSLNRGQTDPSQVAEAASPPSADVIVSVDLAKLVEKGELRLMLEAIENYMLSDQSKVVVDANNHG
jgi:hypothetical protein